MRLARADKVRKPEEKILERELRWQRNEGVRTNNKCEILNSEFCRADMEF